MKITAQEEYGLRCLLQLAQATDVEKVLTVKEIGLREGLSPAYVEKLLRLLSRAGLIRSVRGVKGGYLLKRNSGDVRLAEVIRALGKVPSTGEICQRYTGNQSRCVHIDNCCIRSAWATLTQMLENFFETTLLADLVGGREATVRKTLGNRNPIQTRFPLTRGTS